MHVLHTPNKIVFIQNIFAHIAKCACLASQANPNNIFYSTSDVRRMKYQMLYDMTTFAATS